MLEIIVNTNYSETDYLKIMKCGNYCNFEICDLDFDIGLNEATKLRDFLDNCITKHEQEGQKDVPTTNNCNIKNI